MADFAARAKGSEDFCTRLYVNKRDSFKIATTEHDASSRTARKRNDTQTLNKLKQTSCRSLTDESIMCSIVYAAADDSNLNCAKTFNKQDNVQKPISQFTTVTFT